MTREDLLKVTKFTIGVECLLSRQRDKRDTKFEVYPTRIEVLLERAVEALKEVNIEVLKGPWPLDE